MTDRPWTHLGAAVRRRVVTLVLVLAALFGLAAPAAAERVLPVRRHEGRITVVAERGLDSTADRLLASSGKRLALIEADLPGLPRPDHVEIRVVDDAADMQAVAPDGRRVPAWAAGVAFPDLGVLIVARTRGGQVIDVGETLAHELAHLALGAAVGARAPRWLHEGFAYQHSADWSWDRTETLAQMAWAGNIQPLDELERTFPAAELPAQRAYAQSYDFVGFLAKRGRWEDREDDGDRWPFRRFLGQLAAGADLDSAARAAFGRPLEALYQEWREDLRRRFFLLPAGVFAFLLWAVSAV
nr:hypothetical protein [Kofleriaceae bacterium]